MKNPKNKLPEKRKSGIENLPGIFMNNTPVHDNSSQPHQLQAQTFAKGSEIHPAPGQEEHPPHEAWHVIQQKLGRIQPVKQMKGDVGINDDPSLENEADEMGRKAANTAVR